MFDEPENADRPAAVPVRPMGRIPVIARLVYGDHAEWVPARAVRWTSTHVMVLITDEESDVTEHTLWLRSQDISRRLRDRISLEPV